MSKKVTIYTRVYNTEKYLKKCLDSIINQTFTDFQHIVIDNGCTDGCTQMLKEYAEKYPWVKLIRFEKNRGGIDNREYLDTPYVCQLDSDDWLEPDFLEKTIALMESENADIVATGSMFHSEANGSEIPRKIDEKLVISSTGFAQHYAKYHAIFRTVWAKLYRTEIYKSAWEASKTFLSYGSDTAFAFSALRKANRVCIDNSVLHHYLVRNSSASYEYNPRRSESDLLLYEDAEDFLSAYGPISRENRVFMYIVYANAVTDTVRVISNSKLSPDAKLSELRKIMEREVTRKAYTIVHPHIAASRCNMLAEAMKAAYALGKETDDFRYIVDTLIPQCSEAVTKDTILLLAEEKSMLNALGVDDRNGVMIYLLDLIRTQKYMIQFDLGTMISKLAYDKPFLCDISDTAFIAKHSAIYLDLWHERNGEALDKMTDYLLQNGGDDELFLQIYLMLAALMECVDEFIFGKIKTAEFYIQNGKRDECAEIINELDEMGVEDNDDIIAIKEQLK